MPKKHETPSSKSPKSSSTRDNSDLVVRQVSGTHSNTPSSPTEGSGGGSEVQSASQRSSPPPNPSSRRSELADRPARTTNSGTGRNRTSPTPAVIDNYLAYRKQAFIKIFMARVCEWLDDNVYYLGDAQDQDGDCQRGSKASRSGDVNKRRTAEARPVAGQKRQLKGRDQDDEGSGSDENNEQKPNKKRTKTDEDDDRQKFACPYYKNDPVRYKSHRTCVGPGWHEIHRVKEHLYRKHRIYACNRCFEAFKSEDSLHEHQRADVPCPVLDKKKRKLDPGAGMDQETEKHLRVRRQPGKHDADKQDDVSKWYEVYYTLFPGTQDIGNPPSPWYDANPDKTNAGDSNSRNVEFLKYLRRELPHMIQRELEKDLNRSFERYGDGLMNSLSVWIRNSSARCAQIFEHIPSPAQVADLDDPETARRSRAASPQVSTDTNLTVGVDEEAGAGAGAFESTLDFDFGIPDFDISNILNFDPVNVPSDFPISDDQCFTYPDSAYGTGSVEDASGTRRSYM